MPNNRFLGSEQHRNRHTYCICIWEAHCWFSPSWALHGAENLHLCRIAEALQSSCLMHPAKTRRWSTTAVCHCHNGIHVSDEHHGLHYVVWILELIPAAPLVNIIIEAHISTPTTNYPEASRVWILIDSSNIVSSNYHQSWNNIINYFFIIRTVRTSACH